MYNSACAIAVGDRVEVHRATANHAESALLALGVAVEAALEAGHEILSCSLSSLRAEAGGFVSRRLIWWHPWQTYV